MKLFSYICQTKLWEALKIDKLLEMPRFGAQTSETWDQHQRGVFTVSLPSCYCGILVPCSLKRTLNLTGKKINYNITSRLKKSANVLLLLFFKRPHSHSQWLLLFTLTMTVKLFLSLAIWPWTHTNLQTFPRARLFVYWTAFVKIQVSKTSCYCDYSWYLVIEESNLIQSSFLDTITPWHICISLTNHFKSSHPIKLPPPPNWFTPFGWHPIFNQVISQTCWRDKQRHM